jgi:hypothetical protein
MSWTKTKHSPKNALNRSPLVLNALIKRAKLIQPRLNHLWRNFIYRAALHFLRHSFLSVFSQVHNLEKIPVKENMQDRRIF